VIILLSAWHRRYANGPDHEGIPLTLVHIVADDRNKISELRALFGSQHHVTSALLNDENRGPNECDALIVAVDLRNADNIGAFKEVSAALNSTARKIFVIDRK